MWPTADRRGRRPAPEPRLKPAAILAASAIAASGGAVRAADWQTATVSAPQVGTHVSAAFDPAVRLTVACRDEANTRLMLWHDADGDLLSSSSEWAVLDEGANVGRYAALAFDVGGRACVAYYDQSAGDLRLWCDDNLDFQADASERRVIDSAGIVGRFAALAFTPGGAAVVSYYDDTFGDLKLWHDANGNLMAEPAERRTIHSAGTVGQYTSLVIDPSGRAAVAFYDVSNGDLLLWRDADGDFAADPGEVRVIASVGSVGRYAALTLTADDRAAAAFSDDGNGNLNLWFDADGDFAADAGELRVIESVGDVGTYTGVARDWYGRLLVSHRDAGNGRARLWYDMTGDLAATAAAERTAVHGSGQAGFYARVLVHPNDRRLIVLSYDNQSACLLRSTLIHGDVNRDGAADAADLAAMAPRLVHPVEGDGAGGGTIDPDVNWDGHADGDDLMPLLRALSLPGAAGGGQGTDENPG